MTFVFTPIDQRTGERMTLTISREEHERLPQRGMWMRMVSDLPTGTLWLAWGTPCGLGCHCDAAAVPVSRKAAKTLPTPLPVAPCDGNPSHRAPPETA